MGKCAETRNFGTFCNNGIPLYDKYATLIYTFVLDNKISDFSFYWGTPRIRSINFHISKCCRYGVSVAVYNHSINSDSIKILKSISKFVNYKQIRILGPTDTFA